MRYTREDLKALQAETLDEKIDHSLSMIEIFYLREHGNCYISFSGGKDSTVLKYLIEHEYPARGGRLLHGDLVYTDADGNEYEENPFSPAAPLRCTGCERTGCMFCPFGAHLEKGETRFQRLRRTHPRQYEFMMGGGEWTQEDGKRLWMPNKRGLGYAKVFDMVNAIYGENFYRYECCTLWEIMN